MQCAPHPKFVLTRCVKASSSDQGSPVISFGLDRVDNPRVYELVSKKHCELRRSPNGVLSLLDFSFNGSFVNRVRITGGIAGDRVASGDEISLISPLCFDRCGADKVVFRIHIYERDESPKRIDSNDLRGGAGELNDATDGELNVLKGCSVVATELECRPRGSGQSPIVIDLIDSDSDSE